MHYGKLTDYPFAIFATDFKYFEWKRQNFLFFYII
jgi:hypothetical protein